MKILLISTVLFVYSVSAIVFSGNGGGHGGGGNGGKATCPIGYKLQPTRENGVKWCLKYFSGNVSFFDAEKICRCQGGATLSGIAGMTELKWVAEMAENEFEKEGIQTGGIWVGAYRRKMCRVDDLSKRPECTPKTQYQWTDRHTVSDGLVWEQWTKGAPHNNKVKGIHPEYCVQLQVSLDDNLKSINEKFDNRACTNDIEGTTLPAVGFLCGRPAKIVGGYSGGYGGPNNGGDMVFIGAGKPQKKQ